MKLLNPLFRNLIVSLLIFFFTPGFAKAELKIIFTSNMPEILLKDGKPGYAELSGYLESLKSQGDDVIFIHGGDSLAPNSLSVFDKGAHIIDVLNLLSPAVMSISKRELAFGIDELTMRTSEAQFPMLVSNLIDSRYDLPVEGVLDQYKLTVDGKNIGITSILDKDVVGKYITENACLPERAIALQTAYRNLTASKIDISILVTDDLSLDFELISDNNLFDIVLISNEDKDLIERKNKTVLAHSGGMDVQIAEITIPNEFPAQDISAKLVALAGRPADPKIVKIIKGYSDNLSHILDVEVGITESLLDTSKVAVRVAENAFGNLVADIFRLEINADIAVHNGGAIRGKKQYPPGTMLTRRDVQTELPFPNKIQRVEITGSELYSIMENAVSKVEEADGRFLHISGFQVIYDTRLPPGSRIKSIMYKNEKLKLDEVLQLVTTDYLIGGGDGYTLLKGKEILDTQSGERMMWHFVADYIKRNGSISPVVEGRLIDIASTN